MLWSPESESQGPSFFVLEVFFLAVTLACGSTQARDGTRMTAATQATAATMSVL